MSNENEQKQADELREKAKHLLNWALKLGDSVESVAVRSAIDCIINAALIESALISNQAAKEEKEKNT